MRLSSRLVAGRRSATAAVGSLRMRTTSRPASSPASRVACRWASLKYAGTVMTALLTGCAELRARPGPAAARRIIARDFLRPVLLVAELDLHVLAHLPLDRLDGALRGEHPLVAGRLADEQPAVLGQADERRQDRVAVLVEDDAAGRRATTATSLLVVPRSMPTIRSAMIASYRATLTWAYRNTTSAAQVAAADLFDHLAGRPAGFPGHLDDLHPLRVERFAGSRNLLKPGLFDGPVHAGQAHPVAGDQAVERGAGQLGRLGGPLVPRLDFLERGIQLRVANRLRGGRAEQPPPEARPDGDGAGVELGMSGGFVPRPTLPGGRRSLPAAS